MIRLWFSAAVLLRLLPASLSSSAPLYSEQDPLRILDGRSLKSTVGNSSSAWLVQFYASWCGHCIRYSGTWKALAQDVKEWRAAIGVAVLDCSVEDNFDVCKEFSIKLYPTFKYFRAHSPPTDYGTIYRGKDRRVQTVRQLMVNILQNHTEMDRPKYCPPLEPYSSSQLLPLLGQRSDHYTAIIVEEPDSYLGREVILDLVPFSGVQVVRALTSDRPLLDTLRITAFPTIYLLQPNGTHTHLHSEKPLRFFFSSLLKSLPGVQRRLKLVNSSSNTVQEGVLSHHQSNEPWRDFDRSKVYVADLESALHYLLRVEMATHGTLEGEELKIFKDFVTLVAKLYPNGGSVVKLMETLSDWLIALPLQRIPYQAVLDLVDNKMRISGVFLPVELRWVGCQGSRPGLRGYPCSLWTLFHVLTVQHEATPTALDKTGLEGEAAPVLQVMRRYIRTFFGCEECGRHFEEAAAASMSNIQNKEEQVMWLWEMHNRVNDRLAGSPSNDPLFPKAPWPSTSLCSSCHEENDGIHIWNRDHVLLFLRHHYGASNLSQKYSLTSLHLDPARTGPPKVDHRGGARSEEERNTSTRTNPPRQEGVVGGVWILGFNSVDMSLCLLLYVSSCLFLMLLFFFFRVRSRRWKLRYSRLHV
ncbi:sulfhydryl oxidase 2 isoform 2-T2 [Pholidichthys leucotaenia]